MNEIMHVGEMENKAKVVRQYDDWSCVACVAAMITGESLADVYAYVGHDGSGSDERYPNGGKGFYITEIYSYLMSRGYVLAIVVRLDGDEFDISKYNEIKIKSKIPLSIQAMVTVHSPRCKDGHVLYWSGNNLYDPHFEEPVNPNDYKILEWRPFKKFDK